MLITAIAFDRERNLGNAYNEVMARLYINDWACFIDHDALFTTREWYQQLTLAIESYPLAGMFTAVTNRVGNPSQVPLDCPIGHNMLDHFMYGKRLYNRYGSLAHDITRGRLISGVLMCLSKRTWLDMGKFKSGFLGVDNRAHKDIAALGRSVYILPGLYLYHWYRADGVNHINPPLCEL